MAEHSPLPWSVTANPMRDDGVFITFGAGSRDYQGQLPEAITPCQIDRANAEFIVTAVNHHDELVAALRAIVDDAVFLSGDDVGCVRVGDDRIQAARVLLATVKDGQ